MSDEGVGKSKGGHARARALDPDARTRIARKAAAARWSAESPQPVRFVLRKRVLALVPEIEIDQARYQEYRRARYVLTNGLAIEEKYEIVVANYLELEQEVLRIAANDMVRGDFGYGGAFADRLALNRRVVN